jgi:hypothetical protein
VQSAFGTTIHHYKVNGVMHYANSTDLTIPAALSPLVSSIRGLNDFRPKPQLVKAKPNWTMGPGNYVLAPDDFATIYDIAPMYSAGINGSGIKIAIMGQSDDQEPATSRISGAPSESPLSSWYADRVPTTRIRASRRVTWTNPARPRMGRRGSARRHHRLRVFVQRLGLRHVCRG